MSNTLRQYDEVVQKAKNIFLQKAQDYGTSWRVLRPISVVDQVYIKARRIRQLQEGVLQKVADDIPGEFRGIINYCIIGLIQLSLPNEEPEHLDKNQCEELYDNWSKEVRNLMINKNHDYGEAWRNMSEQSLTDLILMKLHRMRQIIRNNGKTLISEGLDANYMDMLNYAVFALILRSEAEVSVSTA